MEYRNVNFVCDYHDIEDRLRDLFDIEMICINGRNHFMLKLRGATLLGRGVLNLTDRWQLKSPSIKISIRWENDSKLVVRMIEDGSGDTDCFLGEIPF